MKTFVGLRTWSFAVIATGALEGGLYLCLVYPQAGVAIFGLFAAGIGAIMAAVAGKSAIGELAQGDGVKGAAANLLTAKKPGETAAPGGAP